MRLSFIPKVTDMIAVPENTDFIRMGSYDKDISSYVDGTRVKISYADGKTEELVFDDSDSVETSRGDEVRAEIVTDMENECLSERHRLGYTHCIVRTLMHMT